MLETSGEKNEVVTVKENRDNVLSGQLKFCETELSNSHFPRKHFGEKNIVRFLSRFFICPSSKFYAAFNLPVISLKYNTVAFSNVIINKYCKKNQTVRFLCQNMYLTC